jgi:hypothetical protein
MARCLDSKINLEDDKHFDVVANELLNNTSFFINTKEFRILEVEFYLFNEKFQDRYTHKDDLQLEYGKLYFHRINGKSYKSGTFKCMDFTFGSRKDSSYCGVLIRAMIEVGTTDAIVGPCKCVNRLLEEYGCKNVKDLEERIEFPIDLGSKDICVEKREHPKERIFIGPRIGLSDKYPEWQKSNYRYVIMKQYVKKGKTKLQSLEF